MFNKIKVDQKSPLSFDAYLVNGKYINTECASHREIAVDRSKTQNNG